MTDQTDQLLEEILRVMRAQIAVQKPFLSEAAVANAFAWIASLQAICGDARRHCDEMHLSAVETEKFLVAVLRGVYECTRKAVAAGDEQPRMH
jgi:hypothetical protein